MTRFMDLTLSYYCIVVLLCWSVNAQGERKWGPWSLWSPCRMMCKPTRELRTRVRTCKSLWGNRSNSGCIGKPKEVRVCPIVACAIGGFSSSEGKWSWQVFIEITKKNDENEKSQCGGTLISSQWILSAGHCFLDPSRNTWKPTRITLGTTFRDGTKQGARTFSTAVVYIHKDFNPGTLSNDISLLKLPVPVTSSRYIGIASLPQSGTKVKEGKSCIVTGWGATDPDGTIFPDDLQEVDVNIYGDDDCVKLNSHSLFSVVAKQQICAGHVKGGKDTCVGDSGGPLVCHEGSKKDSYVLRGITSNGPIICGSANQPGVYTRVSQFLKWIDQTIRGFHWSEWKKVCSVTCGEGVETQTRSCLDNKNKVAGTSKCQGISKKTTKCNLKKCLTYQWSQWSGTCSVTCGKGKKHRTRECLMKNTNKKAKNSECGNGKTSEIAPCKRSNCAVYLWSKWTTTCSVTCGGGLQTRTRICVNGKNNQKVENHKCGNGNSIGRGSCRLEPCQSESYWSSWKVWCTATCGTGTQIKVRECYNKKTMAIANKCKGLRHQVLGPCNNSPCAVKGSQFRWGVWSSWSPCRISLTSKICNGFHSATRDCIHENKLVDPQRCRMEILPTEDFYRQEFCVPKHC